MSRIRLRYEARHDDPSDSAAQLRKKLKRAGTKSIRNGADRLGWTIILVAGRTILIVLAQAIFALVLLLRHHPSPWLAAAPWSTSSAPSPNRMPHTSGLVHPREGIGIRDLVGKIRLRRGHDIFAGLGWFLLVFPFFGRRNLGARLVYGPAGPDIPMGLLQARALPLWAIFYSLSRWWMIWSPTEDMTYNGYAFPRLEVLFGRSWLAILVVAFWWTLQHCALPLIFDWKYILWRFCSFLPGVLVILLIYRRTRSLPPLILAHWLMDIGGALMTLKF